MIRVGTGRATLSFPDGLGLFGFGTGGGRGRNAPAGSEDADTLQVRALYLENERHKHLVVSFDLPSGSRIVHRALLEALAREGVNLLPGQLWVLGTHTHSGPGHYLGNLYDVFGQMPLFYRSSVAEEIVRKGRQAARDALRTLKPCRVGSAQHILWGAGRNRSLRAFLANFGGDPTKWQDEIELPLPGDATPEERAIDPRLSVVAFVGEDDRPLATWSTWSCHPASIRRAPRRAYHRDWVGVAVDEMEKTVPFAMVHQGANGDVTALPSGERRITRPMERVGWLGRRIAGVWKAAFADASAAARADARFEVGYQTLVPKDVLPSFEIGAPVLAGSEEFDPWLLTKMIGEARTFAWRKGPQAPKLPALGPLQSLMRVHPSLQPSPEHPVGLLRLGSHLFFASPFEQTTVAARTVEKKIRDRWRSFRGEEVTASPIGLMGDYAGYVTTEPEFHAQHYEGGHTLYGKDQLDVLSNQWTSMIEVEDLDAKGPAYQQSEPTFRARVDEILARL